MSFLLWGYDRSSTTNEKMIPAVCEAPSASFVLVFDGLVGGLCSKAGGGNVRLFAMVRLPLGFLVLYTLQLR